jgi:hypothetical protein
MQPKLLLARKREFLRTLRLRDFYNYEAMLFA